MELEEDRQGPADESGWRLIVQPGDGVYPLVQAVENAKHCVEILIFRFDRPEVEAALVAAVRRGVSVHALIAWTNRGGDRILRSLEARLLAAGVAVSRTADDLARYHGKMLIVDRKRLFVLSFNFTGLDIDSSRGFGVSTNAGPLVNDAVRLFEADCRRRPFKPAREGLVVSPFNAREALSEFIAQAREELIVYDPCAGDRQMVRLLEERRRAGVDVRLIGTLKRSRGLIETRELAGMRLHTRTMVRDRCAAFIGSQSLRAAELDGRREIGLFVTKKALVEALGKVFDEDWKAAEPRENQAAPETVPALSNEKLAKKVARAIAKELPPVDRVIEAVAADLPPDAVDISGIDMNGLEETIRSAVKTAVRESIREAAGNDRATV